MNLNTNVNEDNTNNLIETLQQKFFENYYTIAYIIIIGTVRFINIKKIY